VFSNPSITEEGLSFPFPLERCFGSTWTGELRQQVAYGITSLSRDQITPKHLLAMIRSYWGIEDGLHYRRDVTLYEDRTRTTRPNAARVMACLNNLVLSLLIGKETPVPPLRQMLLRHQFLPRFGSPNSTLSKP
jgi:hypothetical protein